MNPEALTALERLRSAAILSESTTNRLRRVARGERVPVRTELRVLLYLSVLLVSTGVGLLVKENLSRVGPVGISLLLALAAGGCLVYVARRAAPFTWGRATSQHLAIEYVLLLGALLVSADLAYIERSFPLLDAAWSWHLLLLSLVATGLGVRYDSRSVFSLGLTSLAAWRGVSANTLESPFWAFTHRGVSLNALACGLLFVAIGVATARTRRKAHFEGSATYLGWLLVLGSLYRLSIFGLFAAGIGLALLGARVRRYWLFALGVAGGYVGASRIVTDLTRGHDIAQALWFLTSSIAVIALLVKVRRRWQDSSASEGEGVPT